MKRVAPILVLLVQCILVGGCSAKDAPPSAARNSSPGPDWSKFSGRGSATETQPVRPVPEVAQELTGISYIRSIRLGWSRAEDVPTFEQDKLERRMPSDALQAVLAVDVRKLPPDAAIKVEWFYDAMPGKAIYTDDLAARDDGEQIFALVMREGGRLVPLPKGSYRVELHNGPDVLKSIPFEVG